MSRQPMPLDPALRTRALTLLGAAVATRRRGRVLALGVAAPRMVAAALFLITLLVVAPADVRLWAHTAMVAVPYLAVTGTR